MRAIELNAEQWRQVAHALVLSKRTEPYRRLAIGFCLTDEECDKLAIVAFREALELEWDKNHPPKVGTDPA